MERLLKDAEELTGKKYDISSYSDIIEAIHAIQTEMGITGTTAQEADKTIEGSTRAMKASWENLVTAFIRGENVKQATQQFGERFKVMLDNVVPAVTKFFEGFSVALDELAPVIDERLPEIIDAAIPAMVKATGTAIKTIAKAVPKLLTSAFSAGKRALASILNDVFGFDIDLDAKDITFPSAEELATGFGKWWEDTAVPALNSAMVWTLQLFGMPAEDAQAIAGSIGTWWSGVVSDAEGALIWFLSDPDNPPGDGTTLIQAIGTWWSGVKKDAEGALEWVMGIPDHPHESGAVLRLKVVGWWNTVKQKVTSAIRWMLGLPETPSESDGETLSTNIGQWWDNTVVPALNGALKWTLGLFGMPAEDADTIAGKVGEWWSGIVGTVETGIRWVLSDPDKPGSEGESIATLVGNWWTGVKADAEGAVNWALGVPEAPYKSGVQLRQNISNWWRGFKGRAESVLNWIIGVPDTPGEEETASLVKRLQTWWDTTVVGQVVPGIERFVQGLFGFGPKYADDLSEEEIVELERLRKEAQAEADKLAGEFFDKHLWQPIKDFFQPFLQPITDFFAELRKVLVTMGLIQEEGAKPVEFTYKVRTDITKDDQDYIDQINALYGEGSDLANQRILEAGIHYDTGEVTGKPGYYKINTYTGTAPDENQAGIKINKAEIDIPPEERTVELEGDTSAVTDAVGGLNLEASVTLVPDMSGWSDNDKWAYYNYGVTPGHAKGLNYVPYDNYVAELHRGERVLTQSEARRYREGESGISTVAMVAALQDGLSQMVVQLGEKSVGRIFGDATTARINRNIGRIEHRRALAYGG